MTTQLSETTRVCKRCQGEGRTHSKWAKENGYEGPEGKECPHCKGTGIFPGFHPLDILSDCLTRPDRNGKRRMYKSFPHKKLLPYETLRGARAYYVWRIARFHGGIDPKTPVVAEQLCQHDPFRDELENLASYLAEQVFGTSRAGALRWARAMGL